MESFRPRSRYWTIFLNLIFPGFGYFYLGLIRRGIIILGIYLAINLITSVFLSLNFTGFVMAFILIIGIYIYVLVDSYQKTHRKQLFAYHPVQSKWVLIPLFIVCWTVSILSRELKRTQSFIVPAASMCPSVHVGDRLIADMKPSYVRGGIYVHANPSDLSAIFVKRLVGLPGDKISIQNGELFINQKSVINSKRSAIDKLKEGCSLEIVEKNTDVPYDGSMIYEAKIDEQYFSLLVLESQLTDFEETVIPPDHYFFIGDNLNNSFDSRFYGAVQAKHILGRALFSYFSSHNGQIFWGRIGNSYLNQ